MTEIRIKQGCLMDLYGRNSYGKVKYMGSSYVIVSKIDCEVVWNSGKESSKKDAKTSIIYTSM